MIISLPNRGWLYRISDATRCRLIIAIIMVLSLPIAIYSVTCVKDAALRSRIEASRHIVEAGINTTYGYYNAFTSGKISSEDAQKAAITVLSSMTYDKDNYVYGYDYKTQPGKILLIFNRVRPELKGVDRTNALSPDGVKYVQAGYNVAKSGGGFYTYMWDAGGTSPVSRKKISYAAAFEPWGWYIGTGTYVDDIFRQYWDNISFVLAVFAAFLAISSAFIDHIYKRERK